MKILVTGAAGFLGSHLSDKLLSSGHQIVALDNLYTGSLENLVHLQDNHNFEFHQMCVTEKFDFEVDLIINMACPASPVHYQKNPVETIRTNVLGIINCLELAKKFDIPVFQMSTSEVYGDPMVSPQNEKYWGNVNPIGIRSCYDEGKRVVETLLFDYHRQYGTKIKIARIFNTYGPRMNLRDGRVVSNFITQALRNEPITIYGDGLQTRSFCYVSDLIIGLENLALSPDSITGPINLGNPIEVSMIEIAKKIIEMTESRSKIIKTKLPEDDPKQRKPDISLATKTLGWIPMVDLKEGLEATINDFKQRIFAN